MHLLFRTLIADLKRSILSPTFLVAVVITIIAMAIGSISGILKAYEQYGKYQMLVEGLGKSITQNTLSGTVMLLCMPILASIPYTTAFVDDVKSGFTKHFLTRTSYRSYIVSKVVACGVASALVLGLGVWVGSLAVNLAVAPIEAAPMEKVIQYDENGNEIIDEDEEMYIDEDYLEEIAQMGGTIPFSKNNIYAYMLSAALWSLVGLLCSSITMNKYMGYASPFIFYYVLVILAERYFRKTYVLNPQNYLTLTGNWNLGAKSVFITLALFIVGISLVFYLVAQRQLRN